MSDRIPRCKNGQPCPLPPPVRETLPQYTGCEGCQREFILVTTWTWNEQDAESHWSPLADHEAAVRAMRVEWN